MKKNFHSLRKISALVLTLMLILSAVSVGLVSAETVTPTYEVFGETKEYDLTGGLEVADTILENGAAIINNSTATRKTIVLGTDIQDFKISFKFQNGNITDTSGNIEPVLVKMRGRYTFTNPKYNVAAGDIYFAGGGETERRIQGGGSTGWHNVEITMKGSKVVIIYDGIRWYETELVAGTTSAELSVSLKYADTQIADLKVEEPTDYDIARVVNADFSTAKNTTFPVPGNFNADESAKAVTATQQRYTLGSSEEYNSVYNYTLESTFKLDGVVTAAYQRGVIFNLPTGNAVAFFTDKIRTATSNAYLYNKDYFTEIAAKIQDGNYHTVRIESVNDTESVFLDDVRVYTFNDVVRTAGRVNYENAIQDGTVYLKNIVLTDYVAPVIEGAPTYEVFGETENYDFSSGLVFDGDTLENGSGIVTNLTENDRVIKLADNVQDFKLSYKFKNGVITGEDEFTIVAPVMARMRETADGAYAFAGAFWQNYDITFLYHHGGKSISEEHRDQYGGWSSVDSDNKWHTVEIMAIGERVVIIYDGVRWHDDTIARDVVSGELSIRLRYANTKIADLKVEEVTEADLERAVDINFETRASSKFPLWYNSNYSEKAAALNTDEDALVVYDLWSSYNLKDSQWKATDETVVNNYVFETTVKFEDMTGDNAWQRGLRFDLPSGHTVAMFGSAIRYAETGYITDGSKFAYKDVNFNDGNYHTIKVVAKNGKEAIYYDGAHWKTFDADTSIAGNIVWDNERPDGNSKVLVKSIKLTDISNLDVNTVLHESTVDSSKTADNPTGDYTFGGWSASSWIYEEISGVPAYTLYDIDAYGSNRRNWLRNAGQYGSSVNGWKVSTSIYLKSSEALASGQQIFNYQIMLDKIKLYICNNQWYMGGATCLTDTKDGNNNGYINIGKFPTGQWVKLDVAVVGDYIYVTVGNDSHIFKASYDISTLTDSGTCIDMTASTLLENNLSFAKITIEDLGVSNTMAESISAIGDVTAEGAGAAIIAAEDALAKLGKSDVNYVYNADELATKYAEYDALFDDGDATENGEVDVLDFIRVKKIAAGAATRTVKSNVNKDADKVIDAADTVLMKKILLGVVA